MGLPAKARTTNVLGPALAQGRTLADWEPHPRVIPDEERAAIEEACKDVAPLAALYVETWLRAGNHSAAAAILGISPATPTSWRRKHPPYQAIFDAYSEEIRDRWNAVAQHKGMTGFRDWMYDGKGVLKGTRVREDPGFLGKVLGSIDPDRWGRDQGGQTINITVQQVTE